MSKGSMNAARLAAGAVCSAVDDVVTTTENRVFCAVRPPGHHAETGSAMGFCLLNSIAIGALHALQQPGIERVAIVDFDVHHGNGSVDICQHHPEIMVCSSFQHPYYPNRLDDLDQPNIVNTPLQAGSNGDVFRRAISSSWLPALQRHQPDLVLVSAGFDAHQADPLAAINLTEADFSWITQQLVDVANQHSQGRIVSTLEGRLRPGRTGKLRQRSLAGNDVKPCWLLLLMLVGGVGQASEPIDALSAAGVDPMQARLNYMLNCQGCHAVDDGRGLNDIPAMADFVGKFLTVDGGRAYLVQVPGSANAP